MDRNTVAGCHNVTDLGVALRKESVDRNTGSAQVSGVPSSVALRKESVDRNNDELAHFHLSHLSLSARRAWIEINSYTCYT